MSNAALIIGGNEAGLQAALDLADAGIRVHLVETSPFLGNTGGIFIRHHILNTRMLEVARHPNIELWTNTRINRAEGEAGRFNIELRQHPRYVDLSRCTACGDCVEVCPITVPGSAYKAIRLEGQPECMAIEKLGKPACANTCPGGIHVQGYVALIAQGRFQEAIDLVREAIPFPGICGRVCTHPCEVNCRRAEIDEPVAVRLLKRFLSDWEFQQASEVGSTSRSRETRPVTNNPKRVAIIGAGPGGMAVADRLARMDHRVTVFEKAVDALTSKDEKADLEKAQKELEEAKKQLAAAQAAATQAQASTHITSAQAQSAAQKAIEEANKRAAEAEARAKQQEERIRQMIDAKELAAKREAYFASIQAAQAKIIAEHTMTDKETLSHLALKYYGHATKPYYMVIYEANKAVIGDNPNRVKPGLKIKIPELPTELKDK